MTHTAVHLRNRNELKWLKLRKTLWSLIPIKGTQKWIFEVIRLSAHHIWTLMHMRVCSGFLECILLFGWVEKYFKHACWCTFLSIFSLLSYSVHSLGVLSLSSWLQSPPPPSPSPPPLSNHPQSTDAWHLACAGCQVVVSFVVQRLPSDNSLFLLSAWKPHFIFS